MTLVGFDKQANSTYLCILNMHIDFSVDGTDMGNVVRINIGDYIEKAVGTEETA